VYGDGDGKNYCEWGRFSLVYVTVYSLHPSGHCINHWISSVWTVCMCACRRINWVFMLDNWLSLITLSFHWFAVFSGVGKSCILQRFAGEAFSGEFSW